MRSLPIALLVATGALAGCTAAGPPLVASPGAEAARPPMLGSPFADRGASIFAAGMPLIIDRTDLRIGTTVEFRRVPTAGELNDLTLVSGFIRLVLALPAWPGEYAALEVLNRLPEETDVVVVLPGYPPSRAAAEAWNLLGARARIVVVVPGPPPSAAVIADLNSMRGLERVIAQMDEPARSGFERLQRPLSFRKLVE